MWGNGGKDILFYKKRLMRNFPTFFNGLNCCINLQMWGNGGKDILFYK
jgi:hypothetical protein